MEFGGDWTRTNEDRSRGIYSPLQLPLCDTPRKRKGCWRKDLNPQPSAYKADALPLSYTSLRSEYSRIYRILAQEVNLSSRKILYLEGGLEENL